MTPSRPTIPPPRPDPSTPSFRPPPGTVDSHCHVFGPAARFPFSPHRTFTPHDVPETRLRALHRHLGIDRAVIVQSACHGFDHAALTAALAVGEGRYRGVALLSPDATRHDVAALHESGVRGVRLQFMPHLGPAPGPEEIRRVRDVVAPFGWHIAVHVAGRGVLEHLDTFRGIDAQLVIDHLARIDLADRYRDDAVAALKRLLDRGNVWLKVSGADRVSRTGVPYDDAVALAATLVAYAPERVVWGTDFPHPNISAEVPDDGVLLDLLPTIAPDPDTRRRLLIDNPTELFDFPT